ncbi:kinase-like domain-containing protein, partial [Hyaloraphidium curvatum]
MASEGGKAWGPVRAPVDFDKLAAYLEANAEGFRGPFREIGQFGLGQSNPTYYLEDSRGTRYVCRRKPAGKLAFGAHQIDREFRVQKAVGAQGFPVPKVLCYCKDTDVIGVEFYVMLYTEGRVLGHDGIHKVPPKDRKEAYISALQTLALLHSYDHKKIGLEGYGKDKGYYPRSIQNWAKLSGQQAAVRSPKTGEKTKDLERLDFQVEWLKKHMPPDEATVAHLDFMFHNFMLHPTENRVVAVLDWETSTIGHPLADLGYFMQPHFKPWGDGGYIGAPRSEIDGIPTAEQCLEIYCTAAGRPFPIPRFEYNVAFSFFRTAVIHQGIASRYLLGTAASPAAATYA